MKKIIKENWPLVVILIITVTTQIIYWQAKPELGNCYDCGEYQDLANFISRNPKNIISDFRPPLYPVLMIILGLGSPNPRGDFNLYLTQSIVLLVTLIVLWLIGKKINIPPLFILISLVLLAINPAFYSFTKFKLTETVNILLLAFLVLNWLYIKKRPSLKGVFCYAFFAGLLTFTRFANSYLVIVMFLAVIFYSGKKSLNPRYLKIWALGLAFILIPQIAYAKANWHRNYYYGLTGETGTNLLGKLVQYQLIPKTDPDYQKIIDATLGCKGTLATTDVFTCVWNFLPKNSFVSKYSISNMHVDSFNKKYIIKNLPTYIVKSAPIAFEALKRPASEYLVLSQTNHPVFDLEIKITNMTYKLLILWLITVLPIYILINIRKILSLELFSFVIILIIGFYYVAITALAAINDYQRIVTPAIPFLFLIAPYITYLVLSGFRLPKTKMPK